MANNVDKIIKKIEISMKMEKIPLTKEDKSRLKLCLKENKDINDILQEIIINHTYNTEIVSVRQHKEEPASKTSLLFPLKSADWLFKIIRRL
jgi:hypothetical protein